jgi:hypothetical protein
MQELQLATPRFRLRSLLLAGAAAFVGILCFTSAVEGCSGEKAQPETRSERQQDWPDGFVELDSAATALPSPQQKAQPSPR